MRGLVVVVYQYFLVFLYYVVDVKSFVGDLLVEIVHFLETQFLDKMGHSALHHLDFAVLHPSLQHFLGILSVLHLSLFQCLADFRLSTACIYEIEPILLGLLVCRGNHFYLVAAFQYVTECDDLSVDFRSHATVSHV